MITANEQGLDEERRANECVCGSDLGEAPQNLWVHKAGFWHREPRCEGCVGVAMEASIKRKLDRFNDPDQQDWDYDSRFGRISIYGREGGIAVTPPGIRMRPAIIAFSRELRAARLHAGLSTQKLARRAGMTRQGLVKIEQGRNVTLGTIVLLADALGCQIADFFPRRSPWRWDSE